MSNVLARNTLAEMSDADLNQRYKSTYIWYKNALQSCIGFERGKILYLPVKDGNEDIQDNKAVKLGGRFIPPGLRPVFEGNAFNLKVRENYPDAIFKDHLSSLKRAWAHIELGGDIEVLHEHPTIERAWHLYRESKHLQVAYLYYTIIWGHEITTSILKLGPIQMHQRDLFNADFTLIRGVNIDSDALEKELTRNWELIANYLVGDPAGRKAIGRTKKVFEYQGRRYNSDGLILNQENQANPVGGFFDGEERINLPKDKNLVKEELDPAHLTLQRPRCGWYEVARNPVCILYPMAKQFQRGISSQNFKYKNPTEVNISLPAILKTAYEYMLNDAKNHKRRINAEQVYENLGKFGHVIPSTELAIYRERERSLVYYKDAWIGLLGPERDITLRYPQYKEEIEEVFIGFNFTNKGKTNAHF